MPRRGRSRSPSAVCLRVDDPAPPRRPAHRVVAGARRPRGVGRRAPRGGGQGAARAARRCGRGRPRRARAPPAHAGRPGAPPHPRALRAGRRRFCAGGGARAPRRWRRSRAARTSGPASSRTSRRRAPRACAAASGRSRSPAPARPQLVVAGAQVDVVVVPERGAARLALSGAEVLAARPLAGGGRRRRRGARRRDPPRHRRPGAHARVARGGRPRGPAARADRLRGASSCRPPPSHGHEHAHPLLGPAVLARRRSARRPPPAPTRAPTSSSAAPTSPGLAARPTDGWYLAAGVYPSRDECGARGGLYATGERAPNLFRFDAPAGTTIARLVSTYRAHLSGAAPWAVPTFVVEAGHGGEWEYIPPARGYIGAAPIDLAGTRAGGDAHGADALRIGVRCELTGPCTNGGQPWARFLALGVVLTDARAPSVGADRARRAPARGRRRGAHRARRGRRRLRAQRSTSTVGASSDRSLCATVPASLGGQRHVTRRVPCPLDAPDQRPARHAQRRRRRPHAGRARGGRRRQRSHRQRRGSSSTTCRRARARVALTGDAAEALTAQPRGFSGEAVTYDYRWERCGDTAASRSAAPCSRTYRARGARRRVPAARGRRRHRRRRDGARRLGAERPRPGAGARAVRRGARRDAAARPPDRVARARPAASAPHDGHVADARAHPRPPDRPDRPPARPHPGADARALGRAAPGARSPASGRAATAA